MAVTEVVMARRKGGGHPGLAEASRRDDAWTRGFLEAPDFQVLDFEQKEFMAQYVKYRDARKAAHVMGKTLDWVYEQEKVCPEFNDMVLVCMDHPHDLATQMMNDMVPSAVMVLYESMNQDKSDRLRLDAAKQVLNLAGVGNQEGGNSLVNLNIEMFGKKEEVIQLNKDIKIDD